MVLFRRHAVILISLLAFRADSVRAAEPRFIDHSLIVAPDYPCTWPHPAFPVFLIHHVRTIGPESVYNIDTLQIDGNTGTQLDVPPHSVVRPELKRPKSGPFGNSFTDVIEPWQFCGEACVVDIRDLLDQAPKGMSPLVKRAHVMRFEKKHRAVGPGDVVLFRSDYSDKYYRPLPEGHRFIADILNRKAPGYPDPDPDCMEYLASRKVMILGTDSASMGPLPTLAEPTHYAGLKYGMVWTESGTAYGKLPPTGAFYCTLGPRHKKGQYGEIRAFSIVDKELSPRLIRASRAKRAIELSPVLEQGMPISNPGALPGRHRQPYLKVDFQYAETLDLYNHLHLMDGQSGTSLVPPAYALPKADQDVTYSPTARGWLQAYESKYGPRGTSDMTTELVPLSWTCGNARVIDVRSLGGTLKPDQLPDSPEITAEHIKAAERQHGSLAPGDIVIFRTGHIDEHYRAAPNELGMWSDPLAGKSEGWPAPGPDAIVYLKSKGIRCVATDAPDLGGVNQRRAAMTYWALGSREMVGVEFLHNVGAIPTEGNPYFLFAALKIRDCHGGPGRAIVLY